MLDQFSDSATIRAELIAAGLLRPGPHPDGDEHPNHVVRMPQDGQGRRTAALTIYQYEHWLVSRLLLEGPPWLRAELERLQRQHGRAA